MQLSDFDYELPPELVAQSPVEPRDSSRLMQLERSLGRLSHHRFEDLPALLRDQDVLVVNDSRVIPARLRAIREPTGGHVELLLVRPVTQGLWEAMARPAGRLRPDQRLRLHTGAVLRVVRRTPSGLIELEVPSEVESTLDQHGVLPLPPYIRGYSGPPERYQTVYASNDGSVAAPTAGLHFTPALLDTLRSRGVEVERVTLHVGPGTFLPVTSEDVASHKMHFERFLLPEDVHERLSAARSEGRRVIAVGTTAVRTLEAAALDPSVVGRWTETGLFIRPGFQFRAIDGLITNFHLPRSTLLMLVSALAGREAVLDAYRVAVREGYRFFSFGDAMLIV